MQILASMALSNQCGSQLRSKQILEVIVTFSSWCGSHVTEWILAADVIFS